MGQRRRVGYTVRRLPSRRWQALVTDQGTGKQIPLGTWATKGEAEAAGQAAAADQHRRVWHDPRAGEIELRTYLDGWLERRQATGKHGERYADDAGRMVRLYLAPHLGRMLLCDITPTVIARWHDTVVAERLERAGTAGLMPAKTYRLLHAALEDAVRDQLIARNPCMVAGAGVERSPERPLLEPAEIVAIADHIRPQYRALIVLAGFVGLRFGELAGLRRRHIDLDAGTVTIEATVGELSSGRMIEKAPKTVAGRRTIYLGGDLVPLVAAHLDEHVGPAGDDLVFTSPRGMPLRRSNFRPEFEAAVRAAGITKPVVFHDLRHAAGTLAAQLHPTERELQAHLGHASAAAARRYQHAAERRASELGAGLAAAFTAASDAGGRRDRTSTRAERANPARKPEK